jgi:hypothetical protein
MTLLHTVTVGMHMQNKVQERRPDLLRPGSMLQQVGSVKSTILVAVPGSQSSILLPILYEHGFCIALKLYVVLDNYDMQAPQSSWGLVIMSRCKYCCSAASALSSLPCALPGMICLYLFKNLKCTWLA